MNGQQAMARDKEFLRRHAAHMTAEEIEHYAWLAGEVAIGQVAATLRDDIEADVQQRLRDEREESYDHGMEIGLAKGEQIGEDRAAEKHAVTLKQLREHAEGIGAALAAAEQAA